MGDAFVDRALGNATEFTQPLQDFVNEHAWGSVWSREGLPLKTRSLITLAALTALKCPQELKGHVRGALNNGCTVEIREALLHCAVYAGVPAAIDAFRAAQEVIDTYQKPETSRAGSLHRNAFQMSERACSLPEEHDLFSD
jgi:4-carboxymuconolactone decarboxylase